MKRICFLSSSHPATDKRVFDKEARALRDAGFAVIHLCGQSDGEPIGQWTKDRITIESIPRAHGLRERLYQFVRLYRKARSIKADAYHCNEVDSWVIGALLRLTTGRKCVVDIHEHYPSTFAEQHCPRWARPLAAALIRLLFMCLTPLTSNIVLAKRSVEADFWFAKRKQVLVRNYTPLSALQSQDQKDAAAECRAGGPPTVVHFGLISRVRGWPQLLEAVRLSRHNHFRIHVIGTFNDGTEEDFLKGADAAGVRGRIRIDNWMPFEDAFNYLLRADIGLILFQPGVQNHVFALPHKLFDYMLAGLPVLTPAFAVEVEDVVANSRCGISIDTSSPREIAAALDELLDSASLRIKMGENGRNAVLSQYNWECEAARLVNMYQQLLG